MDTYKKASSKTLLLRQQFLRSPQNSKLLFISKTLQKLSEHQPTDFILPMITKTPHQANTQNRILLQSTLVVIFPAFLKRDTLRDLLQTNPEVPFNPAISIQALVLALIKTPPYKINSIKVQ